MPDISMREESRTTVFLPSLGADMDWGAVVKWQVEIGDRVERGDVVAVVETEKADVDVEVWSGGTILEFVAPIGEELPVGAPLLIMESVGGDPCAPAGSSGALDEPTVDGRDEADEVGSAPRLPKPTHRAGRNRVRSSPLARARAAQQAIDLDTIDGTGPDGAVLARDLPSPPSAIDPERQVEQRRETSTDSSMRSVIARRMTEANRTIPHYHLERDIDVTSMLDALERANSSRPIADRILPAAVILWAIARTASAVPALNGTWNDDTFQPSTDVDLAVAISVRSGGLVTPVISAAQTLGLDDMMSELKLRTAGARSGSLRSSWMADASLTVSNLGDLGADRVDGIIFPPQVCLVGVGRIQRRPWVIDETVTPRSIMSVTLSADHRATDGAIGSRFLAELDRRLQSAVDDTAGEHDRADPRTLDEPRSLEKEKT